VLYYWLLVATYALAPRQAYRFSELVEIHAHDRYDQFCRENEAKLKQIPPPLVAARYYRSQETLYMFDGFQDGCGEGERRAAEAVLRAGAAADEEAGAASLVSSSSSPRRPPCNNLYDVFINIRDDEAEHVVTMKACADDAVPEL
jgi:ubiquinol oxidase